MNRRHAAFCLIHSQLAYIAVLRERNCIVQNEYAVKFAHINHRAVPSVDISHIKHGDIAVVICKKRYKAMCVAVLEYQN